MSTSISTLKPRPSAATPRAEDAVENLLLSLGEDPSREGLQRTPERVAKAMRFLTAGYDVAPRDVLNGAVFEESYRGLLLVKDIEFYSLCEHHMLPFHGVAHIAYLPAGKVIGLSKLPRLLEIYARRLQVQERLTVQVADALDEVLRPRGVAVILEASHFCMMMRGVQKQNSTTTTMELRGGFQDDPRLRQELFAALGRNAPLMPSFDRAHDEDPR